MSTEAFTDADLVEIKRRLAAEIPPGHTRMWSAELVGALVAEIERLTSQLHYAHRGLERALDFRTASPDGLDIKEDVRDALRRSGNPGPWGHREQF